MPQSTQRQGNIADPGADVSPFATKDFEHGAVGLGAYQPSLMNQDLAGFQSHLLPLPGQVISPLALDLDGGICRRRLGQAAGEAGQDGFDSSPAGASVRGASDFSLGIVAVAA